MSKTDQSHFSIRTKTILIYSTIGFVFGMCFPVGALVLEIIVQDAPFSIGVVQQLHQNNPLLYMIDTAPVFLGLFAMFGGISKAKTNIANVQMSTLVTSLQMRESENNQLLKDFQEELTLNRDMSKEIQNVSQELATSSGMMLDNMDQLHQVDIKVERNIDSIEVNVEEIDAITKSLLEQFELYVHATEDMYKTTNIANTRLAGHILISDKLVHQIKHIMTRLTDLSTLAKEVESITDIISDISANIKLLSLNARIESSRAGEAGKGFAVVATEIQKLSSQTDEAVGTITQKIQSVTHGVLDISTEMDKMNQEGIALKTTNEAVTDNFESLSEHIEFVKSSSQVATNQMKEQSDALSNISEMIHDVAKQSHHRHEVLALNEENIRKTADHIGNLIHYTEEVG